MITAFGFGDDPTYKGIPMLGLTLIFRSPVIVKEFLEWCKSTPIPIFMSHGALMSLQFRQTHTSVLASEIILLYNQNDLLLFKLRWQGVVDIEIDTMFNKDVKNEGT